MDAERNAALDHDLITLLVVEDDPADQALIRRACGAGRFRLEIVDDGSLALDCLLRRGRYADAQCSPRPALVLLDLNLDGESGFTILKEIRDSAELRSLGVIILTTSSEEADVRRSYELGANSFITKPTHLANWKKCFEMLAQYWLGVARLPAELSGGARR